MSGRSRSDVPSEPSLSWPYDLLGCECDDDPCTCGSPVGAWKAEIEALSLPDLIASFDPAIAVESNHEVHDA